MCVQYKVGKTFYAKWFGPKEFPVYKVVDVSFHSVLAHGPALLYKPGVITPRFAYDEDFVQCKLFNNNYSGAGIYAFMDIEQAKRYFFDDKRIVIELNALREDILGLDAFTIVLKKAFFTEENFVKAQEQQKVIVEKYPDYLEQKLKYHQEFLEKYEGYED